MLVPVTIRVQFKNYEYVTILLIVGFYYVWSTVRHETIKANITVVLRLCHYQVLLSCSLRELWHKVLFALLIDIDNIPIRICKCSQELKWFALVQFVISFIQLSPSLNQNINPCITVKAIFASDSCISHIVVEDIINYLLVEWSLLTYCDVVVPIRVNVWWLDETTPMMQR